MDSFIITSPHSHAHCTGKYSKSVHNDTTMKQRIMYVTIHFVQSCLHKFNENKKITPICGFQWLLEAIGKRPYMGVIVCIYPLGYIMHIRYFAN